MTSLDRTDSTKQPATLVGRQQRLLETLTDMVQSPEAARLDLLIADYQSAEANELHHAADTIVALYLRSKLSARRRLRQVITAAIQEQPDTALGLALIARFGALVISFSAMEIRYAT